MDILFRTSFLFLLVVPSSYYKKPYDLWPGKHLTKSRECFALEVQHMAQRGPTIRSWKTPTSNVAPSVGSVGYPFQCLKGTFKKRL